MMDPDRRQLSARDLRGLLDLGYGFGECGRFPELAQMAVEAIPGLFGRDCWAVILEFSSGGEVTGAHISASHREIFSFETYGEAINMRMVADHPLAVHEGQQLPVQIRDFEMNRGVTRGGLHRATRCLETRHQACQWITVSRSGSSLLGLNRENAAFSQREIALIGELRNLLATAEVRLRQVESVLRFAEAMGEGSPLCGWVEIDVDRWHPLRMAGPAEGWLAALRTPEEGTSALPAVLREAMANLEEGETTMLECPGVPSPGLHVVAFPGVRPGRLMMVLRHPVCRSAMLAADLTRREREVLSLAGTGRSRGEISLQLGIAKRTVDKHLEHIHEKLEVSDWMEALVRAGG